MLTVDNSLDNELMVMILDNCFGDNYNDLALKMRVVNQWKFNYNDF